MRLLAALLLAKWAYAHASLATLTWILEPTVLLVETVTGLPFDFEPGLGYTNRALNLAIEQSCSGVNFLLIAFAMLAMRMRWWKALPSAYAATVCANALRICVTIVRLQWLPEVDYAQAHRVEGVIVYFLCLCVLARGASAWRWYLAGTLLVPFLGGAWLHASFWVHAAHVGATLITLWLASRVSLHAIQAVLPSMKARGGGSIVNIASFGGLASLPRLAPYVASKHALVGLSQTLYAELAASNICVTTVNPGIMRSGSHWNMKVRGPNKLAFAVAGILYSSPFAQSADVVARRVLHAVQHRTAVLDLTLTTKLFRIVQALAPNTFVRATALLARLLPGPSDDTTLHTAADSQSAVADRKARKLNELPHGGAPRSPLS